MGRDGCDSKDEASVDGFWRIELAMGEKNKELLGRRKMLQGGGSGGGR